MLGPCSDGHFQHWVVRKFAVHECLGLACSVFESPTFGYKFNTRAWHHFCHRSIINKQISCSEAYLFRRSHTCLQISVLSIKWNSKMALKVFNNLFNAHWYGRTSQKYCLICNKSAKRPQLPWESISVSDVKLTPEPGGPAAWILFYFGGRHL